MGACVSCRARFTEKKQRKAQSESQTKAESESGDGNRDGSSFPPFSFPPLVLFAEGSEFQVLKSGMTAENVLRNFPYCFLAHASCVFVGEKILPLPRNSELQAGEIYFIFPHQRFRSFFTENDFFSLYPRATAALATLPAFTSGNKHEIRRSISSSNSASSSSSFSSSTPLVRRRSLRRASNAWSRRARQSSKLFAVPEAHEVF